MVTKFKNSSIKTGWLLNYCKYIHLVRANKLVLLFGDHSFLIEVEEGIILKSYRAD